MGPFCMLDKDSQIGRKRESETKGNLDNGEFLRRSSKSPTPTLRTEFGRKMRKLKNGFWNPGVKGLMPHILLGGTPKVVPRLQPKS